MTLTMLSKNSPNMVMMMMNESSSPTSSTSTTVNNNTPISNTTTNCNNNNSNCTLTTTSSTLNNNLTREQLERFVCERQHIQDNLRERNILRDYETNRLGYQVSHTLSSTIEKILWKKRQSSLSQKLENRPNIEQLEQRGIIPFLHHYFDQPSDTLTENDSEKLLSNNSSGENSPVSSPRMDHDHHSLHTSSNSPSSIPYLYDHEQTLSGIGIGREEKERKKRQIESFLVRRPSKKDLLNLFSRRGNASPTGLLGNPEQENPALIYDVTASGNLSTFDPMSILLEPHVLQIHNQLESIYNQRVDVSSSDIQNLNEKDEESIINNEKSKTENDESQN